ncbi:MAG TPA: hypothetical protein PKK06_15530 [Phycisphaerae bacterium]|nr:hypothetical protein [Phycisphaerae bacterium]HNU45948.1 hypothetical protein [Phycisphaerae bacterium]
MLFVALTFWILVAVATAWGIHSLWGGLVKPKVFNTIVLPGTLVAQLGHVLGLLVTGATVSNTTLFKDDDSGEPETTKDPKPRIPVLGPIVIGLLPLLACAAAVYIVARYLGGPIMSRLPGNLIGPSLPTTLHGFWQLLRDQITLVESLVSAALAADAGNWRIWVFAYLLICFTVRMAPFAGNVRGSVGAILLLGIAGAALTSLFDVPDPRVQSGWAVLNLTVATLLFLLLVSLLVRGAAGLVKVLRSDG